MRMVRDQRAARLRAAASGHTRNPDAVSGAAVRGGGGGLLLSNRGAICADPRTPHEPQSRRAHDTRNRDPIDRRGNRNPKIRQPVNKVAGAVDRIDDPTYGARGAAFSADTFLTGAFLTQEHGPRGSLTQQRDQTRLGVDIRLRHHIMRRRLLARRHTVAPRSNNIASHRFDRGNRDIPQTLGLPSSQPGNHIVSSGPHRTDHRIEKIRTHAVIRTHTASLIKNSPRHMRN